MFSFGSSCAFPEKVEVIRMLQRSLDASQSQSRPGSAELLECEADAQAQSLPIQSFGDT